MKDKRQSTSAKASVDEESKKIKGLQDCKTARPQDRKTLRLNTMYISGILEYLIWPGFILVAWLIVNFALSAYEKKFSGKE